MPSAKKRSNFSPRHPRVKVLFSELRAQPDENRHRHQQQRDKFPEYLRIEFLDRDGTGERTQKCQRAGAQTVPHIERPGAGKVKRRARGAKGGLEFVRAQREFCVGTKNSTTPAASAIRRRPRACPQSRPRARSGTANQSATIPSWREFKRAVLPGGFMAGIQTFCVWSDHRGQSSFQFASDAIWFAKFRHIHASCAVAWPISARWLARPADTSPRC